MKFSDIYVKLNRPTRLSIYALLAILGAVFSYVANYNPFVAPSAIVVFAVLAEFYFTKRRAFWLSLVWVIAYAYLFMFAGVILETMTVYWGDTAAILICGMLVGVGSLSLALSGYMIWVTGYGPPVLNLIMVFSIYLFTLSYLFGSFIESNLLIPMGISFVVAFLFPLLNWWVGSKLAARKLRKQPPRNVPYSKLSSLLLENITEEPEENTGLPSKYRVYKTDTKTFVILPVAGETTNDVVLTKNTLKINDKDYTWLLEDVALKARDYSKATKTPQKRVVPVLGVPKLASGKAVTPITIRSRTQPQKTLGTVLILNKRKLSKILSSDLEA